MRNRTNFNWRYTQRGRGTPYTLICIVLLFVTFLIIASALMAASAIKTNLEVSRQQKRIACEDFSLAIQPTLTNAARNLVVRHTLGVQNAWNNELKSKNQDFPKKPTVRDITDFIAKHYPALYPITLHGSTLAYGQEKIFREQLELLHGDALVRIDFDSLRLASQPRAGNLEFVAEFSAYIPYTIRYLKNPLPANREYLTVLGSAWYPTNLPDIKPVKADKTDNPGKTPPTRTNADGNDGGGKPTQLDALKKSPTYYRTVEFKFEVRFAVPRKDDPIINPPPPVIRPGTPGGAPATTGNCSFTVKCYTQGGGSCTQWVVEDCNGNPVSAIFDSQALAQEVADDLNAGEEIGQDLADNPTQWTHMFGSSCDGSGGDPKCQVWVPVDIPVNQEIATGDYGVDPEAPPGTEPPVDHLGIDDNSNLRDLTFVFHPYAAFAADVPFVMGPPKYKRTSWQ